MSNLPRYKKTLITALGIGTLAFSCALPWMGKNPDKALSPGQRAEFSGLIESMPGCEAKSYRVVLQGVLENSTLKVETQSDESGRFKVTAPAGPYLLTVSQGDCTGKESLTFEQNTEHRAQIRAYRHQTDLESAQFDRVPASLLVK